MLSANPLEAFMLGDSRDVCIASNCVCVGHERDIPLRHVHKEISQVNGILNRHHRVHQRRLNVQTVLLRNELTQLRVESEN